MKYGYVVKVVVKDGSTYWLGQRVYMSRKDALVVQQNALDSRRYREVYLAPATFEQYHQALSVINEE